jgi:nucleosome binding factor SPN SPT16 subunit
MEEVELACFERMMGGLKNFDLVFVYKNYEKLVTRITAIPIDSVDSIKKWLDSMDIIFFESTKNFVWNNILGTIRKDIRAFVEDGGWNIILGESDDEDNVD